MKQNITLFFFLVLQMVLVAQNSKPEMHIFAVGVKDYQNPTFNLQFADKDARDITQAFQKQKGGLYSEVYIKTLTNAQADCQAIINQLNAYKGIVQPNDVFVFFFSGHGTLYANEYWLVPYDYQRDKPNATLISKAVLVSALKNLNCNYLVLLDACHSGGMAKGKELIVSDDFGAALQDLNAALSAKDKNEVLFGSSASSSRSFECSSCENGYFTQTLLNALDNQSLYDDYRKKSWVADANKDGFVYLNELDEYIKRCLPIMSKTEEDPQKVVSQRVGGTDFPLFWVGNGSVLFAPPVTPNKEEESPTDINYQTNRKAADAAFAQQKWTLAKMTYQDALGYKAGDSYCQSRIRECETQLAAVRQKEKEAEQKRLAAEKEQNYQSYRNSGDSYYTRSQWLDAKAAYKQAIEYKAGDSYCSTRIINCNEQIAAGEVEKKDLPDNMIYIAGGTFSMGSDDSDASSDEKPVHSVTLSNFYMGKYEVTVAEFKAFIDATSYKTDAEKGDGSYIYDNSGSWTKKAGVNWRHDCQGNTRSSAEYNHPVVHVSWNDAKAYCAWLSKTLGKTYSLPTEAQWEYAARAKGKSHKYAWGNATNPANGANVADETGKSKFSSWTIFGGYTDNYVFTCPVERSGSNDIGLYGMSGNVWEWCEDYYASDYYKNSPTSNPIGPIDGSARVLRGGCWLNRAQYVRCAYRNDYAPGNRYSDYYGFRVVRLP